MNATNELVSYDAIIIGSGAGGSAAAYTLARAGLRVMLLEKGNHLPRDGSTLDFNQVVVQGRFNSKEQWLDRRGKQVAPEEHFNVGGKTKWYGAALLRYGRQEFVAEPPYQALAWPISYDDLASYYDQAEQLLGINTFQCESDLQRITERLHKHSPSWQAQSLPMGLSLNIVNNPLETHHFDGFASVANLKADGETAFLTHVTTLPNLTMRTDVTVKDFVGHAQDSTHIVGVRLDDGSILRASVVLLAAGALHSPRLLQTYLDNNQLSPQLPCYANVGRNLKKHILTAMVAISPRVMTDEIRKTTLFINNDLPHSTVQPLGFDGELISTLIPKLVPRFIAKRIGARAYGFFLQTEDGAHQDNRVVAASTRSSGLSLLDYDATRTPMALREHHQLVRRFRNALARTGMLAFSTRIGVTGTAHVSGTLVTGNSPTTSVVDANGRMHGLKSLYVVDGSILPRSSRVNPALTIYAWSLRVSQKLASQFKEGLFDETKNSVR